MPIYEYTCRACSNEFELLVRKETVVACPHCRSAQLERRFSLPAVQSENTHNLAMRAAKRRDAGQAAEKNAAQREYERNHDSY